MRFCIVSCMDGVSDPVLQRELTVVYATEAYLTDPTTVESLRFTVQELQRRRQKQQPCNPGRTDSGPYQSLQGEQVPASSVHTTPLCRQVTTSSQRSRCVESACSRRKLVVHSAERHQIQDPDSKPQQVAAATAADASSAPAAPVKSCTTDVCGDCPTSSIQSKTSSSRAEVEEKADAAQTAPFAYDRVLLLRPADQPTVNAPLTVTCGTKQVQKSLKSTTFDPSGRTILSVHQMISSEQQVRPDLTLEKLKLELASNPAVKRISLPLPNEWYTEGEASTCTAYTPVPVHANINGVDMKFDASVVVDVFPQGVCLGPHELSCYSSSKQEPTGEDQIDERASLVVSFAVLNVNPIPLRGIGRHGVRRINHEFLSLQPCSIADSCSATTSPNRLVCCQREDDKNVWNSGACALPTWLISTRNQFRGSR